MVILLYHRVLKRVKSFPHRERVDWVSLVDFERQMNFIQKEFDVVSLETFVQALKERSGSRKERFLSITFDDGYREVFRHAVPLLKARHIPATFFITTNFLEGNPILWWEKLYVSICSLKGQTVSLDPLGTFPLTRDRRALWWSLFQKLRRLNQRKRMGILNPFFHSNLLSRNGKSANQSPYLGWKELEALKRESGFSIQSHAMTHESLVSLTNSKVRLELRQSKRLLEEFLGKKVSFFAYPFGGRRDISESILRETQLAGYLAGFTSIPGSNRGKDFLFALRRLCVDANMAFPLFKALTLDPERFFPEAKVSAVK